jgi:hypothetical protein
MAMARKGVARNQQCHRKRNRHGDKCGTRKTPSSHIGSNREIHTNPPSPLSTLVCRKPIEALVANYRATFSTGGFDFTYLRGE